MAVPLTMHSGTLTKKRQGSNKEGAEAAAAGVGLEIRE
jgi:hypothetical protein